MSKFLITGGTGYIGSHTAIELLAADHEVVIVDNLSNSKRSVLDRLKKITGQAIPFIELDLCDKVPLKNVFADHRFDGVIHFAGLKAVGESVAKPLEYYRNNIGSTLSLCEVMQESGVKKLIFSSSATVYGIPSNLPMKETSRVGEGITNPYGQTKFMIEQILRDLSLSDPSWAITSLRYFNPIGAHVSGLIGEDPNGLPSNLLPYVAPVAVGKLEELSVYGDDYDTPDGTGVRDYIHVVDLAKGHLAALNNLKAGFSVFNLGTGEGTSVLEIIKAFEATSGQRVPYQIMPRRPGDIASCYADPAEAQKVLSWKTEKSIQDACADSWRWQQYANANL